MLDPEKLKEAILAACQVFADDYNATYDAQVAVSVLDPSDDGDVVLDGGAVHGVLYVSILED